MNNITEYSYKENYTDLDRNISYISLNGSDCDLYKLVHEGFDFER